MGFIGGAVSAAAGAYKSMAGAVAEKKEAVNAWKNEKLDKASDSIGKNFGDDAQEAFDLYRKRGAGAKPPLKDIQEEQAKVEADGGAEGHMFDAESAFQAMMSARRAAAARSGQ